MTILVGSYVIRENENKRHRMVDIEYLSIIWTVQRIKNMSQCFWNVFFSNKRGR